MSSADKITDHDEIRRSGQERASPCAEIAGDPAIFARLQKRYGHCRSSYPRHLGGAEICSAFGTRVASPGAGGKMRLRHARCGGVRR